MYKKKERKNREEEEEPSFKTIQKICLLFWRLGLGGTCLILN